MEASDSDCLSRSSSSITRRFSKSNLVSAPSRAWSHVPALAGQTSTQLFARALNSLVTRAHCCTHWSHVRCTSLEARAMHSLVTCALHWSHVHCTHWKHCTHSLVTCALHSLVKRALHSLTWSPPPPEPGGTLTHARTHAHALTRALSHARAPTNAHTLTLRGEQALTQALSLTRAHDALRRLRCGPTLACYFHLNCLHLLLPYPPL